MGLGVEISADAAAALSASSPHRGLLAAAADRPAEGLLDPPTFEPSHDAAVCAIDDGAAFRLEDRSRAARERGVRLILRVCASRLALDVLSRLPLQGAAAGPAFAI